MGLHGALSLRGGVAGPHEHRAGALGDHDPLQVFGGYGFINEFRVARHYRDAKILEVGEGTTEVQLMLIARELGL